MNNKLLQILNDITQLLIECGLNEEASKVKAMTNQITKQQNNSTLLKEEIEKVKLFMHPRGVFFDRGLVPLPSSSLSKEDAHNKQWELTEKFWDIIK